MSTLQDRLAAAERRQAEAREQVASLRKQVRERERREKRKRERLEREAEQSEALDVLRWLKSHDLLVGGSHVNAYGFIRSLMSPGDAALADKSGAVANDD